MRLNRRGFLGTTLASGFASAGIGSADAAVPPGEELDKLALAPVLHLDDIASPVVIESIELLRNKGFSYVRTRSKEGAVGIAVTNGRDAVLHPIFRESVAPYFIGKDARELERLIDGVYVHDSNYKLSSLALWSCVAWIEFSILDMLGKMAGKPVGTLFGGILRDRVGVYAASGNRGNTPEEEADVLERMVDESGVSAVKFKVGGRMSHNADSLPGRTERLIPLARQRLGNSMTLYTDSNGSYDAAKAIEVGRIMQDHGYAFFEEPCPFDWLEETRQVADALEIPIAGGEQESSHHRFRWMIKENALQVVQPDLHYYGGFIRATRVARMAAAAGLPMVLHLSGGNLGYVDTLHFASFTPNMGPYQEYKEGISQSGGWFDPPLRLKDSAINVPAGPGLGLPSDFDLFQQGVPVGS